jgi:hypothetical protein
MEMNGVRILPDERRVMKDVPNTTGPRESSPTTLDASNIGKVGVCSIGRIGVITEIKQLPWGLSYTGINLTNGARWASREPAIIADSLAEFIQALRACSVAKRAGRLGAC